MKISPSKPIIVFRTSFYLSYTKDNVRELEDIKGEANIRWYECENYRWVWENAIKDSVTFNVQYDVASIENRVVVTAEFEPEDLTYYYMRFGAA